ncbi:uncharacterized protein LOC144732322 [Lampetra planeri]
MANASDPLLEMFTTDVDEKAVSELVGSLESRLSRQRPTVLNSHAQQQPQQPQQQQQLPDRGGGRLGAAAAAGGGASKTAASDLGEAEARSGTLGPPMKRTAAAGILLLQQQQQQPQQYQQLQQLQQQQVGGTNCQRHGGAVASGVSVGTSSASLSSASVAAALPSSLSASSASSLSSTSSLSSSSAVAAASSSSSSAAALLSSPSTSLAQASSLTQSSLSAAASTCSSSSLSSQSSSVSAPASSSTTTTSSSLSNHADVPVLPLGRTPVNGGSVYGTPAGAGGGVVSPARTSSISSGGNSNNGVAMSVVAVDSGRMNFNVTTNLNPNVTPNLIAPNPIITATTTIITTSTNPSVTFTNPNAATTTAAATSNPPGLATITLQRPPASHNGAPISIVSTSSIISTSSNIISSNSIGHPPLMCTTPGGVVSGQPSVISAVASRPAITLISSPQQQQQQQQQQQTATVPTLAPSGAGMMPMAGGHSGVVRVSVPPPPSPGPALSPARPGLALQQRLLPPQIIAPRPQTIQLPPGFTLPPGTVMVRAGEQGQLFLIQQSVLAQAGGAAPHAAPVPPSPTVATVAHAPSPPAASPTSQPQQGVRLAALQIASVTPPVGGAPTLAAATPAPPAGPALPASQPPLVFTPEVMENVKKCKNFLSTLIKLASSGQQSPETTRNVKELVQNLLDAKMEPEEFTSRLQKELKSSPQPYLVPFLKKSLPAVRYLAQNPQAPTQAVLQVNAVGTPTTSTGAARPLGAQTHAAQAPLHTVLTTQHAGGVKQIVLQSQARGSTHIKPGTVVKAQGPALIRPPPTGVPGATGLQASASQKGKMKDPGGGTFKDDDDINDVASMAGVNINEESARIAATGSDTVGTQIRSCRDEAFLSAGPLQRRLLDIGRRYGVTEVPADVVGLVSHAAQERLKNLVERLSVIAQHRTETYRDSDDSEQMSDVRSQLRFFEQLDRLEKQRKDEQEREILLRAAKSRSRQEDPEQARLKQKAKEMQQAELAQMRQREANLTALAAIGPRKKRKLDSPGPGTPGEAGGGGPGASSSGGTGAAGGSGGGGGGGRRGARWRWWWRRRWRRGAGHADETVAASALHQGQPARPRLLAGTRSRDGALARAVPRAAQVTLALRLGPPTRARGGAQRDREIGGAEIGRVHPAPPPPPDATEGGMVRPGCWNLTGSTSRFGGDRTGPRSVFWALPLRLERKFDLHGGGRLARMTVADVQRRLGSRRERESGRTPVPRIGQPGTAPTHGTRLVDRPN